MTARLDRMEGEREVAQLGAVLGREFSHELLAAVAALDEATLQAELAKAGAAETVPRAPASMHLHLQARPSRRRAV